MSQHSEQINELATALAKAQGEMSGASKGKINPHLKSKYADLGSYWDACREALSKNGLCIVQTTEHRDDNRLQLVTTLMHSSGQWIKSIMSLLPSKSDVQGYGALLTYMRRYSLAAMVGIAPEDETDDDGESNKGGDANPKKQLSPKQDKPIEKASPDEIKKMEDLRKKISESLKNDINKFLESLKLGSISDLPKETCLKLIKKMEKEIESKSVKVEEEAPF